MNQLKKINTVYFTEDGHL